MTRPGRGFARRVTRQNINQFAPLLRFVEEPSAAAQNPNDPKENEDNDDLAGKDSALNEAIALFGGEPIKAKVPFAGPTGEKKKNKRSLKAGKIPSSDPLPVATRRLLWEKVLSATDAQRQIGNVTGDLRLTQAKFKVAGQVIDQTTYFRDVVFKNLNWSSQRHSQVGNANFEVQIMGKSYGHHQLVVSHKPTGEAQQGNYTSGIRWGDDLVTLLRDRINIKGRRLKIFGPSSGNDLYLITIE